ncbi:MAG: metal ABC transporter permease [Candidatus Zixiibacteriota bacterium]
MIDLLIWPFVVCVVLVGIHVYFGLHVIKRGIIFVDLSLAQVAALGSTLAFLMGFELDSNTAYLFSLGFALLGALIFAFTRDIEGNIPPEAIIGIAYAVSSAAAIMAVSHSPEGAEHIKYLLIGSILTVTPGVVLKTAMVYALVGAFHIVFFSKFAALTFRKEEKQNKRRFWDFLFYASFGVVVTSSVKICGVLLVFIFLVVPSVFSALTTDGIAKHLMFGWLFGLVGSALGLLLSFWIDTPPGATIVCVFGAMLLLFAAVRIIGTSLVKA